MADVFMHLDARSLLKNKHVLFLGDSNIRAQYKDLVWLMRYNTLISKKSLRGKLEASFLGDTLLERSKLYRGREFKEKRLFHDKVNETILEFTFITRCYNLELQKLFQGYKKNPDLVPDVIVINSCLWDLTRWGPNAAPQYKDNMVRLMRLMCQSLPKKCLVIWSTALPTAPHIKGALIIKQIQSIESMMRFEVMEANTFARQIVVGYGFDVLDNHFYNRMQMHRRAKDGVHYLPVPVRFITNLLLTHIALTWGRPLPNNIQTIFLSKTKEMDSSGPNNKLKVVAPSVGIFSKLNLKSPKVARTRAIKTRGITVTISPKAGKRQCRVVGDDFSVATTSSDAGTNKMKSVVQIPPKSQKDHTATRPYRSKRNKKKNRKRPYDDGFNSHVHPNNTFSFYNPYPMPHMFNNDSEYYYDDE